MLAQFDFMRARIYYWQLDRLVQYEDEFFVTFYLKTRKNT